MRTETAVDARHRPKGDKRERTKARLVEAASALIREGGYEHTTLARVAERAGMTTGAIYGNFKNRAELFMAVAAVKGAPIMPRTWPGMSFSDLMHSLAEALIEALPQRRAAILGTLGFHAYALTDEDLRARVVEETGAIYRKAAADLSAFPKDQLPMPTEMLGPVIHALTDGLVLHRLVTPELVPDEAIHAAFAAIGAGARSSGGG